MSQVDLYQNSYVSYDVFETIAKTFPAQYNPEYFKQHGYEAMIPLFHYLVHSPLKTRACPRNIGIYRTGDRFDIRFVVYDEVGLAFVKRLWALLECRGPVNGTLIAEPQVIVLDINIAVKALMEDAIVDVMAALD